MKLWGYERICGRGHVVEDDNVRLRRYRDGYYASCRRCEDERKRVPVDPGEGVTCLICGDELRLLSHTHLRTHGITTKEYRKRFPGAPMSGEIFNAIKADHWQDQISAESPNFTRVKKQGMCKRGLHRLAGNNLIVRPNGKRECRKCKNETRKRWVARNRKRMAQHWQKYYEANREKLIADGQRWREENRERANATERARYRRKKGI